MLSTFDLAGHVVGLIVDRDLTDDIVDEIIAEVKSKLEIHDKINVFIELEKGRHITFKALWKGIIFKYSNSDHFDKIAIVTDSSWFQNAVNLSDSLLDVDVRTFDLKDRLEAIQWISL
ncbi:STAS/SEC14 domain-containing protein [Christiangramia sp. SM2212]|uniref:STAS/SEC14 domain-containing protein n=1 Tax=Christiangramia sediminicola TaxID=3073267 RepID=A0ABU1ETC9_9FLAO|nr:STAS/SEC14 domain-containing protein [Christiangramia sp. SM2212]MDR5591637.1 STAS/SEC14 domain-containing protein [Christiangramia sp. SM2212]